MTPPAVILCQTQMGENVGATARAMKNFGLSELILVAPKITWPNDRAHMLASGAGDILDRVKIYPTAAEALAGFRLVLATTARGRDVVKPVHTPASAATALRQAASEGLRTALMFGGERAGLENDELDLADAIVTIPTAEFSSLNLGQAALLLGYEWLKAADTTPMVRTRSDVALPATRAELTGLFEHLERELDAGGFFFPAARRETMVRNIRAMVMRSKLTDQEARTLRGIIVALVRNKYRGENPGNDPAKDGAS